VRNSKQILDTFVTSQ